MTNIVNMSSVVTATIAINTALSAAVVLDGARATAIQMPSTWDTANLSFQASADGVTYADVYLSDGTEYRVIAAANQFIILDPINLLSVVFLKVRSATTGTPVNQTAARTLNVIVSPF